MLAEEMLSKSRAPHISVVIPVYGCAECLPELYKELSATLSKITEDFEIIMVNDGSPDNSWEIIKRLAREDSRLRGINLSRNFGQHHAITAGLDYAWGEWVVVMDCDLQDQPKEIIKFYETAKQGYDMVVGLRTRRQDNLIRRLASRLFYKIFGYLTDTKIDHRIGNFGIYSRKVIESIKLLREQNRSFVLSALWVGFRRKEIEIEHGSRLYGKSSYNFRRMFRLAFDSMVAHSNKPLSLIVRLGFTLSILSLIYAGWLVIRYLLWGVSVIGWTSLMVSIYFTAGLIIGTLGIVGLYLGKVFNEVKGRPLYIVESTTFEVNKE